MPPTIPPTIPQADIPHTQIPNVRISLALAETTHRILAHHLAYVVVPVEKLILATRSSVEAHGCVWNQRFPKIASAVLGADRIEQGSLTLSKPMMILAKRG